MATNDISEFIRGYVKGTLGRQKKHGRWCIQHINDIEVLTYGYPHYKGYTSTDPTEDPNDYEDVAYKFPDGTLLVNSNELQHAGVRYAWGNKRGRWGDPRTDEQKQLENLNATPFPFTLFNETGSSVVDFAWVVRPIAEEVTLLITERMYTTEGYKDEVSKRPRHFTGGCVFTLGNNYYLFDVDRQELQHGIFNAFLTKLPNMVASIEGAYDILKPDVVKDAENNGVEVLRQGEFFFIKHTGDNIVVDDITPEEREILKYPPSRVGFGLAADPNRMIWLRDDIEPYGRDEDVDSPIKKEFQVAALEYKRVRAKLDNITPRQGQLSNGTSRSHTVEKYMVVDGVTYASGKATHSNRDHKELLLDGWYKVVGNNAVQSWTITGKID